MTDQSDKGWAIAIVLLLLSAVLIAGTFYLLGWCHSNEAADARWTREAIEAGAMQYDETTGKAEWKESK